MTTPNSGRENNREHPVPGGDPTPPPPGAAPGGHTPQQGPGDTPDATGRRSTTMHVTVEEPAHDGMRVDRYVADVLGLVTRSQLKARHALVYLNEKLVKLSKAVTLGDAVTVVVPEPEPISLEPEPMDLDILYEDRRILVVNKPAGLVVHPGNGHPTHTLVHGVLHHVRTMRDHFGAETARPGIVHRLDKDTSGVIVIAKDTSAHEFLSRQFRDRSTEKLYLAVVHGYFRPAAGTVAGSIVRDPKNRKRFTLVLFEDESREEHLLQQEASHEDLDDLDEDIGDDVDGPPAHIGRTASRSRPADAAGGEGGAPAAGKVSLTRYTTLRRWDRYACVALRPHTGRTHQLRVHMRHLGAPILGDPVYARRDSRIPDTRLMLHAYRLRICHPETGEVMSFRAPIPGDFREVLSEIAEG